MTSEWEDAMTTFLRYRADIWVEVDFDELDVAAVVVDQATLVDPVEVVDARGSRVTVPGRPEEARRIADEIDWPSWDVGVRPV